MNKITSKTIKQILFKLNLYGQTLHVQQIQKLISNNYTLSVADHLPYTSTRPNTKYEYWQAQVQRVLFHLSRNGVILHHPETKSYTF